MKSLLFTVVLSGMIMATNALEAVEIGKAAPTFKLKDSQGKEVALTDYKGKTVVLEWINFDCPFVKKFYGAGEMQKLQAEYTAKGVVWLAVCSSASGKEGNFTADEIRKRIASSKAKMTAYLVDDSGTVGKLYGAKTTPHMFVIAADGTLVYAGAIDSIRSTDVSDIAKADNYVKKALDEVLVGKPVSIPTSVSYGCSVKY